MVTKTFTHGQRCKQKGIINRGLASLSSKGRVLVLDGPDIKTTKALLASGKFKAKDITIVNNSKDYYSIFRKHKNTHHASLLEYVEKEIAKIGSRFDLALEMYKYSLIYLDYMCTFDGNASCDPRTDIYKLFQNDMLKDGAIIGITLSQRQYTKKVFGHSQIMECLQYFIGLGKQFGREIELIPELGGTYRNQGPMCTIVMRIN